MFLLPSALPLLRSGGKESGFATFATLASLPLVLTTLCLPRRGRAWVVILRCSRYPAHPRSPPRSTPFGVSKGVMRGSSITPALPRRGKQAELKWRTLPLRGKAKLNNFTLNFYKFLKELLL